MKRLWLFLLLGGPLSTFAQPHKQPPPIREIRPSGATGSSQAVLVDEVPLAHTAQFLPINKSGTLIGKNNFSKQVDQVLKNISLALNEARSSLDQVIKLNVYVSKEDLIPKVQQLFSQKFTGKKPTVSFVVGDLSLPDAAIAMDAIAVSSVSTAIGKVSYFNSSALFPQPKGAHVSVLPTGGVTYVSGQADEGDIVEATRGTVEQLAATLEHLGITKDQVIQLKSFMQPMADVHLVEKEFADFFGDSPVPPLVFVDWISRDPVIEIELIAASSAATTAKDQMSFLTPPMMTPSPVYSKVTQIHRGTRFYLSSLYGEADDSSKQTTEIFASLKALLAEVGSDFDHLGKATYYVSDQQASAALNDIRPLFYNPKRPPAASKAMVKGVGKSKSINIDMIGVVKE